jgi:hypothetical protein
MNNDGMIALKIMEKIKVTPEERASLSPPMLMTLVIGRYIVLNDSERDKMPAPSLVQLTIDGFIRPTRLERDNSGITSGEPCDWKIRPTRQR